jgi:hypothetical protein
MPTDPGFAADILAHGPPEARALLCRLNLAYTHIGRRPLVGYAHTTRLYAHRDHAGAVHAITAAEWRRFRYGEQRVYPTLCGDALPVNDDQDDCRWPAPDQAGTGVTCRRCRKAILTPPPAPAGPRPVDPPPAPGYHRPIT